ncbi:putative alcohol dehydrogenase [Stipitochalara longipes BDJ]|nr:putative alcohol dehydrogenase [Stipitochalara longipes BDJ]
MTIVPKENGNIAAVLEKSQGRLKTVDRAIPKPGANEIVVRNHAIAANPVDWKIQDYGFAINEFPTVLGSDCCGVVVAVGDPVTKFKVRDRVTGFAGVIYNQDINHGAFQSYTILRDIATTKIPDSMSFEEGSVFPMAMATSLITLMVNLGIPRPSGSITPQQSGFLIWGASSSVGTSAVQLAKNMGFKVFATASPAHHQNLKSLGAFEVFDYHDSAVVEKIVAAAKSASTPITLGFDTVTEGKSYKQAAYVLGASGGKGGKLVLVLPPLPSPPRDFAPDGVEILQTGAYLAFTDHADLGKWFFNEYLEKCLADRSIVSAPQVEVVPGGIQAAQSALDKSKAGVSGKKLVIIVDCGHH